MSTNIVASRHIGLKLDPWAYPPMLALPCRLRIRAGLRLTVCRTNASGKVDKAEDDEEDVGACAPAIVVVLLLAGLGRIVVGTVTVATYVEVMITVVVNIVGALLIVMAALPAICSTVFVAIYVLMLVAVT